MAPRRYSNPKVPERINSRHEHPIVEVLKSSFVVVVLCAVLIFGGFWAGRALAPYTPFSWEQAMMAWFVPAEWTAGPGDAARQKYLEGLAARVAAESELPEGVTVTVHYVRGGPANAFATFGGHVFVFEELWDRLDSENALAMVLGHEIAHVANRDPIRSVGGGLLAGLLVNAVAGDLGFVRFSQYMASMQYSREQERRADRDGLRAVARVYGHVAGARTMFDAFREDVAKSSQPPEFLSSHPNLERRTAALLRIARRNGWPTEGRLTPLPRGAAPSPSENGAQQGAD